MRYALGRSLAPHLLTRYTHLHDLPNSVSTRFLPPRAEPPRHDAQQLSTVYGGPWSHGPDSLLIAARLAQPGYFLGDTIATELRGRLGRRRPQVARIVDEALHG